MTWHERAKRVLIDGCSTFSKRVESYIEGVYCSHVAFGDVDALIMADNTRLLDTVSGLGSNLWECRNNYSLEPVEAVIAAEESLKRIPYHTKIKFVKNGGDACSAAVRYARAYTGRHQVYYSGYHGCSQGFVSCTPPGLGTVYECYTKFGTIELLCEALEANLKDVACAIVEPLELDLGDLASRLMRLRNACNESGTILIFDEIITGWRVPNYTVANFTGVTPDISCLGKALAGGYPLGIVAVTDKIASSTHGVFISHTFGAEQRALRECIDTLVTTGQRDIEKTWTLGQVFMQRTNDLLSPLGMGTLKGYPTRYVWTDVQKPLKSLIWQGAYRRGVLLGAAFFPKLSWTQATFDTVYNAIAGGVEDYKNGVKLDGKPPQPAFKRN
jgi:adenosylmethionine-8-amino-7-oxononanoate aminotransferase